MPEIERGMVLAGRYQIEEVLGKGGSGVVLRAFDRTAQMVVAVKVLKQELVHDPRWSKRFARELRLGRPIRHPNVCRIFDIGEGDGYRFLTMELATGGTLRDLVKKGGPLRPLPERLADARAAISGLAAIHEAGIVHRDVKPDNMLRMDDGRLVLSDFGLATDLPDAAAVTIMVGTPHYMAPEIRTGEPATMRSDVWALGVALYEIFFGKRPERRSSTSSEGYSKPPAPLISTPVERAMLALCERCLVDSPIDRPADAGVVGHLLDAALSSPRRFVRGNRFLTAAVFVLGIGVVGGLIVDRVGSFSSSRPARANVKKLSPAGSPTDWSKVSEEIATFPGGVRCFSMVDEMTARIVWGHPARAEDIDTMSGKRTPSKLLEETFRFGCPDVSPAGAILFAGPTSVGASEIRLSTKADGSDSRSIAPGIEPLWLREEEFLYTMDASHAAVFSLSTMSFALLPDAGLAGSQLLSAKAVDRTGSTAALLLTSDTADQVVAVYEGRPLKPTGAFEVAAAQRIQLDRDNSKVWISYGLSASISTLAALEWRTARFVHVGQYPNMDLVGIQESSNHKTLLARRRTWDIWLINGPDRRRLTSDGENLSAAMSPSGELLLGKRTLDGSLSIWWQAQGKKSKQVTAGPLDVRPDLSPDGRHWAYVDYSRKSIMLCELGSWQCKVLLQDDTLPGWCRFSPDGKSLAYITQADTQRLMVVDIDSRATRHLGMAFSQCPPIWSSPSRIWAFDGSPKHYFWSERDAVSGSRTGKRIEMDDATNDANVAPDESRCWPRTNEGGLFAGTRVEAEETSRLLRLRN
jgi:hypothetical protein